MHCLEFGKRFAEDTWTAQIQSLILAPMKQNVQDVNVTFYIDTNERPLMIWPEAKL